MLAHNCSPAGRSGAVVANTIYRHEPLHEQIGFPFGICNRLNCLSNFRIADYLGKTLFSERYCLQVTVDIWGHGRSWDPWPISGYSIRNACVGLMDAARRAGIHAATSATRTSTAGTSVNVTASCGLMP